jgi:hypothetical protein
MNASTDVVWAVLADPWLYPVWVVGASRLREVDDEWPAAGSRLHHSVGTWPLVINDTTTVVEETAASYLVLQARAWPGGEASVRIALEQRGDACLVTMVEDASHGPAKYIPQPIRRRLIDWRNSESLQRLAMLAEGRARTRPSRAAGSDVRPAGSG